MKKIILPILMFSGAANATQSVTATCAFKEESRCDRQLEQDIQDICGSLVIDIRSKTFGPHKGENCAVGTPYTDCLYDFTDTFNCIDRTRPFESEASCPIWEECNDIEGQMKSHAQDICGGEFTAVQTSPTRQTMEHGSVVDRAMFECRISSK